MTAAVEILVDNLKSVLSVPVQALVEQKGKFFCWVNAPTGIQKREIELGTGNNTRIQVTKGLEEGELVLLNPRESIAEAREEEHADEVVDVKKRFGGDTPADLPNLPAAGKDKGERRGKQGGRGGFNLMSLDTNGDKKISLDEAPDRMKERFGDLDTNGDGFLDASEIAAMTRKFQEMSQQRGGPDGPEGRGGPGGPGGP
jgi:hypothetical protein